MCKILIDSGYLKFNLCIYLIFKCRCKSIDDENVNGLRPLHFAALTGKVNFMKFLIEKGASPVVNDLLLNGEAVSKLPDCDFLQPSTLNASGASTSNGKNNGHDSEDASMDDHKEEVGEEKVDKDEGEKEEKDDPIKGEVEQDDTASKSE